MSRRACFIGRYQTFHDGHRWLIQKALDRGDPVLVLVRDTNEEVSAHDIAWSIQAEYMSQGHDVVAMVIPDIKSVEYGRNVGYDVVRHTPPEHISRISGTEIRRSMTSMLSEALEP